MESRLASPDIPDLQAQIIPVNYLRWDLVTPNGEGQWGDRAVDAPHVRIVSMNAVAYQNGCVVMGEVVNEDTIPAFVNVNAALVDKTEKRNRRRKQLRQDFPHPSTQAGFALSHRFP